jgi:hypothetical protein
MAGQKARFLRFHCPLIPLASPELAPELAPTQETWNPTATVKGPIATSISPLRRRRETAEGTIWALSAACAEGQNQPNSPTVKAPVRPARYNLKRSDKIGRNAVSRPEWVGKPITAPALISASFSR